VARHAAQYIPDYKGDFEMTYEYTKAKPITLRDAGRDEKWLQEVIARDPAILGLGDVVMIQRERPQPTGGRIDMVVADPEEGLRYEVEIMLGTVDESHIIRAIVGKVPGKGTGHPKRLKAL
jgi:hypothetical protein